MFTRLSLKNIKSFDSAEIPLANFTVLLGTNAAGKSNIRDTFRFLHGLSRGYKLIEVFAGKYEGGDQIWQGVRGGPYEFITKEEPFGVIGVEFSESKSIYVLRVESMDSKPPRINAEVLSMEGNILYQIQDAAPNYTNIKIMAGGNFKKGQVVTVLPDEAVLPQLADTQPYDGREDQGINLVKEGVRITTNYLRNMRFLDLSPDAMRESSYPGQNTLGDRGENLSTVLQDLVENRGKGDAIIEWLRALTPMDVAGLRFDRDSRGRVSLTLMEHNKRATSAESASDGTLRFLAYLALAFSVDTPTTCFIEEIDNGIHPSRLQLLVELMETQSKQGKLQVIATSHSPALLNLLSPESLGNAVLVYRTEGSRYSKVKPLKDIPNFSEIAERRHPGTLMESGWFENTLEALEYVEEGAK